MILVFDALKFYKLKSENTARVLFVVVYSLFFAFYTFPIGKPIDFEFILESISKDKTNIYSLIASENVIFYISAIVFFIIVSFFSLVYANCYVAESDGLTSKKGIITSLRSIPSLLFFILLLSIPVLLSSILFFVILIYFYYALYFAPLFISDGRKGVIDSITLSFRITRGIKLNLFTSQVFLIFILNAISTFFSSLLVNSTSSNDLAANLVISFVDAARILIMGRLLGGFYIMAVRHRGRITQLFNDSADMTENNNESSKDESTEDSGNENTQK